MPFWMIPVEFGGGVSVVFLGMDGVSSPGHSRELHPAKEREMSMPQKRENEGNLDHPATTATIVRNYKQDGWSHQSFFLVI